MEVAEAVVNVFDFIDQHAAMFSEDGSLAFKASIQRNFEILTEVLKIP